MAPPLRAGVMIIANTISRLASARVYGCSGHLP